MRPHAELHIAGIRDLPVKSVSVTEEVGNHTVAVILAVYSKPEKLVSGTPVVITWFNNSRNKSRSVVGYINHVRRSERAKGDDILIYVIGGSWVLKNTNKRSWSNYSLDSLIREVVAPSRLKVFIENAGDVVSTSQRGESDWEFIRDLADRYGKLLITSNTDIHLIDQDRIVQSPINNGKYYNLPLDKFTSDVGSMSPRMSDNKKVISYSLDDSRNLIAAEYKPKSVFSSLTTNVEESPFLAHAPISSRNLGEITTKNDYIASTRKWMVTAKALSGSHPNLSPGKLVMIKTGKGPEVDGAWVITSIKHEISPTSNTTAIDLARDGYGEAFLRVPAIPSTLGGAMSPSQPRFLRDRWVS